MTRGSCLAGKIKSGLVGLVALGALAVPAAPAKSAELALTGIAWLTTDYMFRSISNTSQNPAAQVEFDLTYGILYGYVWGSNTEFGEGIELDYGLGITPKWGPVTFNFAGLYYTYPGDNSAIDYFEALAGASWTSGAWSFGVKDYWSPDNFQFFGQSNAIEGTIGYAWTGKLWNFFTPSVSGTVGFQSYEYNADDYVYWNAGLTLGFKERWSADIRYYDTDYNSTQCFAQSGGRDNCDARAVGTIKATF
jgi:uncharacterized protein (TIGR02001 family)